MSSALKKLYNVAESTGMRWWEANKLARGVRGHQYYKMPEMIKYRYPAPGSQAHNEEDHPNLYKAHWKTPFRDSVFNIRAIEKRFPDEDYEVLISDIPTIDPAKSEHERRMGLLQDTPMDNISIADPLHQQGLPGDHPDVLAEIWKEQEDEYEMMQITRKDETMAHWELDDDYDQANFLVGGYEKEYSGIANDWKSRATLEECEYHIEQVLGKERIETGKFKMYKGHVKKWQILDDHAHDRDQIVKIQAAVQAPLPEELEMYAEEAVKEFIGPVNNENTRTWRDKPLATDTADFDPDFLQIDREKRRKFFSERYDQPKQLQ